MLIVARLDQTRLNKLAELDDLLAEHGVARTGIVLIGEHPTRGMQYYYARRGTITRPLTCPAASRLRRDGSGRPARQR